MNQEGFEQQLSKKGGFEMASEDLRREFAEVRNDIHSLHEGTLEGYPKTERDATAQLADVYIIDQRHPVFGRFIGEGDEVLKLDEHGFKELMNIEHLLFKEEISDAQAEALFEKFSEYYNLKRNIIQGMEDNSLH